MSLALVARRPTADELVLSEPEAPADSYSSGGDAGSGSTATAEEAPARSLGGGTLFERMSRLSRGGGAAERDEDKDDGVDLPRFLGRQNNQ